MLRIVSVAPYASGEKRSAALFFYQSSRSTGKNILRHFSVPPLCRASLGGNGPAACRAIHCPIMIDTLSGSLYPTRYAVLATASRDCLPKGYPEKPAIIFGLEP